MSQAYSLRLVAQKPCPQLFARVVAADEGECSLRGGVHLKSSARALPILDPQPRHPAEFSGVVRDQYQVMRTRDRGNHQVVGADGLALRRQISAYQSVVVRASIIERQALQRGRKVIQALQVEFNTRAASCAVKQLRFDHAAQNDVGGLASRVALRHSFIAGIEQLDAGVCVEQVFHSNGSRSSGGPEDSYLIVAPSAAPDIRSK